MRVVIGEDSVLLREGLRSLLKDAGIEVVGVAGDGVELVETVRSTEPDLAIVDVRMPPTFTDEGLRSALEIRASQPQVAILVLSQYVEERYAMELIGGGTEGIGYLLKDRVADVGDFLATLRNVAEGNAAIDSEVVAQLVRRRRDESALDRLTARELDVLGLMAEGRSNAANLGRTGDLGGCDREAHQQLVSQTRPASRLRRSQAGARRAEVSWAVIGPQPLERAS